MTRRLRRYPALGFLAVAALLASLLPSALRVPLSGPTASAELAPVPGRSDSAEGDLSALGRTTTGGLGAGSGLGDGDGRLGAGGSSGGDDDVLLPTESSPPPGSGRNPSNKRCVGKPPRQTEDPWSPPCVAYFKGDNGGATAKGVTRDEVRLVWPHTCGVDGSFRLVERTDALLRYFNERFQTYERRVRVYDTGARPGDRTARCTKSAVHQLDEEAPAFMLAGSTSSEEGVPREIVLEATRRGMMSHLARPPRQLTREHAPFIVSVAPDVEDQMENAAAALCARLAGRNARHAGDPTMWDSPRRFGLVYDTESDPDSRGAQVLRQSVERRCGATAGEIVDGAIGREPTPEDIARMHLAGVTTVILVALLEDAGRLAEAQGWRPEWFAADESVGFNFDGRVNSGPQGQAANLFGLMDSRRLGPPHEQYGRGAYAEGCACDPGNLASFDSYYNELLFIFTGIQAAGPRLTAASFDRGMRAIPPRQSSDPFSPAAYFAPGNHSYIKDFAFAWWDPAGTPPGSTNAGCWRLVDEGRRFRAQDWDQRPGDDGIKDRSAPCQGESNFFG